MRPAASQAEVFTAVRAARLRMGGKVVLYGLGAVFDDELGAIPAAWQPSLTELAGWTGMDRATVKRWLRRLETRWLLRERPDPARARRYHERTNYTVLVPEKLGAGRAGAGRSPAPWLGAAGAGAGRSTSQELGAPRAAVDDDFRTSTARETDDYDALAGVVIDELRRDIPREEAAEIARRVLAGRKIRTTPEMYLRGALQKTPGKWAPAPAAHPPAPRPDPARLQLSRDEIRAIIAKESAP